MIDNTINTATDSGDLTPIAPPTTSNPPIPPLVPLGTWTWNTPVIPTFYWNVYSAEQRIRQICLELGRIGAWCDYATATANANHMELSKRIDELAAKLTEEIARLDLRIDEENKARETADALLQEGLDAETARAKATEQVLQANIDTEASKRENADATLDRKIADETTRASDEEQAIRADLTAENKRAEAAETVLQSNLDAETSAREGADNEINATVRANKVSADEADKRIQDSLDTEIANRKNGDIALGERIDAESTSRAQADTNLETRIDTEASNRATADNLLTQQVNRRVKASNVTAATDSHITVTSTVSDTDPDGTTVVIGDTFAPDFDKLESGLAAEITRATSAETELNGRISHETSDRENADNLLNQAVGERLKATGVIAGDNITVQVDPDASTVTINSTASGFDGVKTWPSELTGNGTETDPLGVNTENIASVQALNIETDSRKADVAALENSLAKKLEPDTVTGVNGISITKSESAVTIDGNALLQASNIQAGDNITVTQRGKQVIIAATAGETGLTEVATSGFLTGKGTVDDPLGIADADFEQTVANTPTVQALQTADTEIDGRLDTLEATMPTKIAAVQHNDTLTGTGTSTSKLGVHLNHTTVMSDTGNTVYPTLMHASDETINGIGFNAGDGLTAYNSEDADTGSGLRLSDETLSTLESALQLVTVNTDYFDALGTKDAPLTLSSVLKKHINRLYVGHNYMQPVKIEFTVEQLSDGNYDLARKFNAPGIVRSNLKDLDYTAPEYGAQLGVLELHDDSGAAVEPGNYNYVRVKFNDVNDDMSLYAAETTIMTFTPIIGTGTTYSIRMQTPFLHKAADGYEMIYKIASTGTSTTIPAATYAVTWYKAS